MKSRRVAAAGVVGALSFAAFFAEVTAALTLDACAGRREVVPPAVELTPLTNLDDPDAAASAEAAKDQAELEKQKAAAQKRAVASQAPVRASFVTVAPGAPRNFAFERCETLAVIDVIGDVRALGVELAAGDVLLVHGGVPFAVSGDGQAVVARVDPPHCDSDLPRATTKELVRATAPELTWAGGTMHAHLDVDPSLSPNASIGRLSGTGAVAAHTHAVSWEVLCSVEGAGTFTIDGAPRRIAPHDVVVVPPGVKHSWSPDPGSRLQGVQFYAPPGPEQRFKALATAALDAGKT